MPGFMRGIHVLGCIQKQDVDGRDKPGHSKGAAFLNPKLAAALAALVDAEKKLVQSRPLPDQTLLV